MGTETNAGYNNYHHRYHHRSDLHYQQKVKIHEMKDVDVLNFIKLSKLYKTVLNCIELY